MPWKNARRQMPSERLWVSGMKSPLLLNTDLSSQGMFHPLIHSVLLLYKRSEAMYVPSLSTC